MQIRVSPEIVVVGPVLRGVVVVLISGPMKRSVGSMDLESSVQSASESFICHHGSFSPLWPVPRKYAGSTATSRGTNGLSQARLRSPRLVACAHAQSSCSSGARRTRGTWNFDLVRDSARRHR